MAGGKGKEKSVRSVTVVKGSGLERARADVIAACAQYQEDWAAGKDEPGKRTKIFFGGIALKGQNKAFDVTVDKILEVGDDYLVVMLRHKHLIMLRHVRYVQFKGTLYRDPLDKPKVDTTKDGVPVQIQKLLDKPFDKRTEDERLTVQHYVSTKEDGKPPKLVED